METPWSRARKLRSTEQEQRVGRMPGGRQQVNSGRLWRWKRDAILREFLIECRTTQSGSYSISKKEFLQIKAEAIQTPPGLLPGMQIDIQDLQLMVIELSEFDNLYKQIVELQLKLEQYES